MNDAGHLSPAAGAVRLEGLGKAYAGVDVVRRVSLDIAAGEIVALLGPSGCGKTTTLRMIAGLVMPDEGAVSIAGRAMAGVPVERRDVGLLFQSYALFPHMTVLGNVLFGLKTWRRRTPSVRARRLAAEALRLVRLEGYEDRYPAQLSGGQQQRVALARALVIEPSVLLLDEPLSALDKNLRTAMQTELRGLVRRLRLTAILVTHDQEEAMTVADRIAVMDKGEIVQVGTPADLYERPRTTFVADFVGATNLIRGRIERLDDGGTVLVTRTGARLTVRAGNARVDRPGIVAVRPERIVLAAGSAGSGLVAGRVEAVTYKGAAVATAIRLPDGTTLTALSLNAGAAAPSLRVDDDVVATWSDDANVLLEE